MNHSQNNEQAVIVDYFKGKIGRFIDIGANDGITFSNTRSLAELGWCGVFVEPSPKAFYKLKQLYSDSKKGCFYMYQAALSTKNGKIDLYESGPLVTANDVGLVSSIYQHETERFKKNVSYEKISVDCFRWKTFLNRLYIKEFDFISIDIEGEELPVLRQMDLTHTQLICVETNGDVKKKIELDEMLKDFKIIYTSPENLIYAK